MGERIKNAGKLIAGTALAMMTFSCAPAIKKHITPIIESPTLVFNEDDSIMYRTTKNEADGRKDLKELTKDKDCFHEELWIHLPEADKWYEVGIMRTLENRLYNDTRIHVSGIILSYYRVDQIIAENPDARKFVFYHNHPTEGAMFEAIFNLPEKRIYENFYRPEEPQPEPKEGEVIPKHYDTQELLQQLFSGKNVAEPSISDLYAMFITKDYLLRRSEDYRTREGIASHIGITSYNLKEKAIKDIFEDQDKVYVLDDILKGERKIIKTEKEVLLETDYIKIRFIRD